MKRKILSVIIIFVLMIGITGCEDEKTASVSGTSPQSSGSVTDSSDYEEDEEPFTGNDLWNSSLFSDSSYVYNDDLALVTAFMSEKAEREKDDDIRTYLSQDCEMYAVETENYGGSAAYAIAQSNLYINGEYSTILLIVARGTVNAAEGIGDLAKGGEKDFYSYKVWNNVDEFYKKIMNGVDSYVDKYPAIKNDDNLRVVITGHSLGGAAADMVAARFDIGVDKGGEWWSSKVSKDDIYAYTFGAIKVLTTDDNEYYGFENIHNIYNYYDSYGPKGNHSYTNASSFYAKFGHTDLFDSDQLKSVGVIPITDTDDHNMDRYITYIKKGIHCSLYDEEDTVSDDEYEDDDYDDEYLYIDESTFLLGSWLSIGDEGFGQAQPDCIVTFDHDTCNFYSPFDTYSFYCLNDNWYLECTNPLWGDTLRFDVYFYDEDNIDIVYGDIVTELVRID